MAHERVTHDVHGPAERVADAAMTAAVAQAELEGTTLREMVAMVRLHTEEAATAAHREDGDTDAAWLATELLYRFEVIMKGMGKRVHVEFTDEPGEG